MKTKPHANGVIARRAVIKCERVVVLDEAEFYRLLQKADEWEPLLPEPDADGNYPALEALRVSLARSIIRDRRRLGLTQAELAQRAGIRPESLNRIELGHVMPTIRTIKKIDLALNEADRSKPSGPVRKRKQRSQTI